MQTETITAKATVAAPTPPANNSVGIYYGECTLYENEIYLLIFFGGSLFRVQFSLFIYGHSLGKYGECMVRRTEIDLISVIETVQNRKTGFARRKLLLFSVLSK